MHTHAPKQENTPEVERTEIEGDTGENTDVNPPEDDEPSDSHTGLDESDQVLLDEEDFE